MTCLTIKTPSHMPREAFFLLLPIRVLRRIRIKSHAVPPRKNSNAHCVSRTDVSRTDTAMRRVRTTDDETRNNARGLLQLRVRQRPPSIAGRIAGRLRRVACGPRAESSNALSVDRE